jgi:uncharacterized protein (DUF1697 family)
MADLREVVLGLGHTEVATYIQSGNVVFTSEEPTPQRAGRQLTRLGGSRTAETAGTARNWATVNKLLALCDG